MSNTSPQPVKRKPFFSIIKPRPLYRAALNRYDNSIFATIDSRDLTEHFNYGFHPETMESYTKLIKKITIEEGRTNVDYDPSALGQLKFNDDIPIDFGGLAPFLHKGEVERSLEEKDTLVKYLIWAGVKAAARDKINKNIKEHFFLTEYLTLLYQEGSQLPHIMKALEKGIEERYDRLMKKQEGEKGRRMTTPVDRDEHICAQFQRDTAGIAKGVLGLVKKEEEDSQEREMAVKREDKSVKKEEKEVKKEERTVKKEEETNSDEQAEERRSKRRQKKEKKERKERKEKKDKKERKERREKKERSEKKEKRDRSQSRRELKNREEKNSRQLKYKKQKSSSQEQEVQYRKNRSKDIKHEKRWESRDFNSREDRHRRHRSGSSSSRTSRR